MKNIVLIGMPGAGKSTIGIILAKVLRRKFMDTDIELQNLNKKLLYQIIQDDGLNNFIKKEEDLIKSLRCTKTIIATGGSVILSKKAMDHLKNIGIIIYLELNIETIIKRVSNIETRGVVKDINQSLYDIYNIRKPLYEKYSDITINCKNKNQEQLINEIVYKLK